MADGKEVTPRMLGWQALICLLLAPASPSESHARARPVAPTVAVLSPGARLVAGQVGRKIHVWARSSGKLLATIESDPMFRGAVTSAALVAVTDRGVVVHRGRRYARQVDLQIPRVLISMGRAYISANGRIAAGLYPSDGGVGDPDAVAVWDARTGRLRTRLTLDEGRVQGVAMTRGGGMLAVFGDLPGRKALLRVFRLRGKKARSVLRWSSEADRTTTCAAFSRDGRRLALCAGRRLLVWDLRRRRLTDQAPTDQIKALFPEALRGPSVRMPGAHQVAFSRDGSQLVTLHGFGVVGVARWSVASLKPQTWIKRPLEGGPMRQIAWDARGRLWLISSSSGPRVVIHRRKGDRFAPERVLSP